MKVIDFAPAVMKYDKGEYKFFANKAKFKNFAIEGGNIVWGENWDIIFPVEDVFHSQF